MHCAKQDLPKMILGIYCWLTAQGATWDLGPYSPCGRTALKFNFSLFNPCFVRRGCNICKPPSLPKTKQLDNPSELPLTAGTLTQTA